MPFRGCGDLPCRIFFFNALCFYVHLLDDIGIIADWVRNAGVDQVLYVTNGLV